MTRLNTSRRATLIQTAAGLTLAALSLMVSNTWAQTNTPANASISTWPNKPIKLIVPFASGGANDLLARAAAEGATKVLGQPVVIDNKPGAGGTLGTMLGITAGQLFGGLLTDTLGWRWAFALMAAAFATVSFLLWQQLKHLEPVAPPAHAPVGFFRQLGQVAHNAWARTFLSLALVEGATVFGVLAVTAAHLHQVHHISLTLAGGTTALFGLGGMAYMATAKITIRRFGEVGLARYGGMGFGCAFLVIAFSPWWQLALPSCFVAGFGFAMFHNTMQAKATQMVPTARGTGVTLFAGFLFLGQSLGVLILAELLSHFNSPLILGADALVVCAMGIFLSRAIAKRNATQADHA